MIRTVFLAFAFDCCLIAAALAIAPSQNATIVLPHKPKSPQHPPPPPGGNCPFISAGFPDGCPAAKAGTPQFPNLLQSYGANRPPWNVAGVDYPVGVPAGTVLKDPATAAIPAGCSANFGNHQISCTSGSPTFDGWDFALEGGWTLICRTPGLLTATNSNFAEGSNAIDMLVAVAPCGGVTLTYSKLDQQSTQNLNGSLLFMGITGPGTFTAMYNWFANQYQDVMDLGPTTNLIKYNLISGSPPIGSSHSDWLQTGSGLFNIDTEFNTVNAPNTGSGSQGYGYGFNPGGNIGNSTLAFNTTIGANVNYEYQVDPTQVTGAVTVHDNYTDTTHTTFGIGSFAKPGSACNPCGGGGTSIFSHNVNMVNGTLFTNNP